MIPVACIGWRQAGGQPQKFVDQDTRIFGVAPYSHYVFLLQDRILDALRHRNSVTIGAPAVDLASGMGGTYKEIAHEFFHTWNLISIHPEAYFDLRDGPRVPASELCFSEGVNMFYADLVSLNGRRVSHLDAGPEVRRLYRAWAGVSGPY